MKDNNKTKKKYRDMDEEEQYDHNCNCICSVLIIGIPLIFLVRYLLLGFAVNHLGYDVLDVYPIWWCFKWIAGIVMVSLIIYFDVRQPGPRFTRFGG